MSGLLLAHQPPPSLPLLGTLQLPLHETAGDKTRRSHGIRYCRHPAVDLGALGLFGQTLAQGAGHMDQRSLGL